MLEFTKEDILENTEVELLEGEVSHKLSLKLPPDVVDVIGNIGLNAINRRLVDRRPDCSVEEVNNELYLVTYYIIAEGVFNDEIKYQLMKSAIKDLKELVLEEMPGL